MEAAGIAHISRIIVQVDRFGGLIWRCHQDLLAHCGRSLGDGVMLWSVSDEELALLSSYYVIS